MLAAVLRQELDWSVLPAATPSRLRRLLARCLERDPRVRLRDIGEARVELDKAIAGVGDETAAPLTAASATASASRGRLPWMVATAAAVVGMIALAIPALRYLRQTPPPAPPETRVDIVTPATDRPADFALSPDGRQIVFVAAGDGASRLWRRSLATTTAQPLAGTEGAQSPFWSPDSRAVAFFANFQLKRLDLGGGASQTLVQAAAAYGGTWNADGVIVFAPTNPVPLMRVAATGGAAVAVTTLASQQVGHIAPSFLPDGRRFLFFARGAGDTAGIYLGALDGDVPTRLTPADSSGVYLPGFEGTDTSREGGWLLWVRAGALQAQRLDVTKRHSRVRQ